MNEYAEPHFDDERTLMSARPVVPLEKIEAKARHRRQWFLGGAFAIAMMLGAASALVASYMKLRNVPQTATELSVEPDAAPAPAEPLAQGSNIFGPEWFERTENFLNRLIKRDARIYLFNERDIGIVMMQFRQSQDPFAQIKVAKEGRQIFPNRGDESVINGSWHIVAEERGF